MPTLLSVNSYHYRRDGGCALYLDHNHLFERFDWNVVPFSMQHPENLGTPWSKYFVTEIEFGRPYSAWEKLIRVPKSIYSFEARRKLDHLLHFAKVDVCHCHCIYHHISPAILSMLKGKGIPTVMTLHDFKLVCPAYTMFNRGAVCERCKGNKLHNVLIHRCIKDSWASSAIVMVESYLHTVLRTYRHNVDLFIVPSQFYKEKMMEWGWNTECLVQVPNFVDVPTFSPNYCVGKSFLYFGRLSAEKGLITLIKAAALANVALRIAGDGPERCLLREIAERSGSDVTFLGHLTGRSLHDAVRASRAVVIPSECFENAPISLLEAYALGKPVIGSAIGGIPELIREGITGVTFESGSLEGLGSALRYLANLPDSRIQEMGRNGRQWVEADFSGERYFERIMNLYKDLASNLDRLLTNGAA